MTIRAINSTASGGGGTSKVIKLTSQTINAECAANDPVYFDGSQWRKADSATITPSGVYDGTDVIIKGEFTTTGLIENAIYYLGTSGGLSTNQSSTKIGQAESSTLLIVDIDMDASSSTSLGAGYWAGGNTGASINVNDKLLFNTDTVAMTTKGVLTAARAAFSANNSSLNGYFAGGTGPVTTNDKLLFNSDTVNMTTKGALSQARTQLGGANSRTNGYWAGGYTGNNVTTTDSLVYSSDTTTMVTKGVITQARRSLSGCNSSTNGYFAGGLTSAAVAT